MRRRTKDGHVRYFVNDVDEAIRFYTERLHFEVAMRPGPGLGVVSHGDLRLLLSTTRGPGVAAQAMPGRRRPEPAGCNRIQLEVDDLEARSSREAPTFAMTSLPASAASRFFWR